MPQTLDLEDLKRQALVERPDLQAAQSGVKLAQDRSRSSEATRRATSAATWTTRIPGPPTPSASELQSICRFTIATRATSLKAPCRYGRPPIRAGLAFRSHHRRRHGVRRLADQQESRRTLSVGLPQSVATVSRNQPVRLPARRRQSARSAGRRAHLSRHAAGYRQALAAYMTSVHEVNFAVGKQVMP